MSDVIQLLPDSVANQIAAGEVIQRPASVVKELVENAIDAGAQTVNVLVTDAGRTAIQVIDNGKGMSETDARLAFERHATSKIRKADDLFALRTMGFRGEALASIAAVAQVEMNTRMDGADLGTRLSVAASKVTGQEPVSCPAGTNFTVENLFFNVPARRKFLKTNSTELNNIIAAYERIVLVYPEIAFTLHSNGTELLNLRRGNLRQRIIEVFGKRFNQDILPVNVETSICRISGFVGKPESARKKGAHEYFFVNGRYMKHPYFHKAVMGAFERMVPQGMAVPYFIYFEVDPADIDVNIHPTKTEIKFENEQAIWQILTAAVKDAVGKFCDVPTIDFDTQGRPDIPVFDPMAGIAPQLSTNFNPSYNPFSSSASRPKTPACWEHMYETSEPDAGNVQAGLFDDDCGNAPDGTAPGEPMPAGQVIEDKSPVHYQYKGRYIMTAVKSGLMVIDQHRADMRIKFEKYLERMASGQSSSQGVLFPEVATFTTSEDVVLQKIMPELQSAGFDLSDLGHNSYAINGVPAMAGGANCVLLLKTMVCEAAEKAGDAMGDINRTLAMGMARTTAISQGEVLGNQEMENLINELFACSNVNYTPDGKPIIAILPQREIEQLLG